MFLGWNARQGRFADVKTREALALLTDRKTALEKFAKGLRPMTNGPWGIDSPYQCPKEKCPPQGFDPAKAKALLKDAGWADTDGDGCLDRTVGGEKQALKFTVLAGDGDYYKNVLGFYTTEMKKAGVCADIRQLDLTALYKLVEDLNFDAYFGGYQLEFPINPRDGWHSSNVGKRGSNTVDFIDPEVDKMVEQFEAEFDDAKRQAIGQKIHERIWAAHPMVWHHEGGGCLSGWQKTLQGVTTADFQTDCNFWPRWYKVK
jgi:ABC-type transport system substrate-binding protein